MARRPWRMGDLGGRLSACLAPLVLLLSCFEGSMSIACVGRCGVRPPRVVRHIRRRVGVISEIGKDQGLGKLVSHLAQYHGTLRPSNNLAAFHAVADPRSYIHCRMYATNRTARLRGGSRLRGVYEARTSYSVECRDTAVDSQCRHMTCDQWGSVDLK